MEIEQEQAVTAAQLLDEVTVKLIPDAVDLGSVHSRTVDCGAEYNR